MSEFNIPIYGRHEIENHPESVPEDVLEFRNFAHEFINSEEYGNKVELGIFKKISTDGTKVLSKNQLNVAKIVVSRYSDLECSVCGVNIHLSDAFAHEYPFEGMCGYHYHTISKDD